MMKCKHRAGWLRQKGLMRLLVAGLFVMGLLPGCSEEKTNPLLDSGFAPWAVFRDGYYYYTQGAEDVITLWKTTDITRLRNAPHKVIYATDSLSQHHCWAPELHYIDHKWYLYYTADDGNTDNHQIYVAVNPSPDPMKGVFTFKAHISTDPENHWAIHPSTFSVAGKHYLIWSGWEKRRVITESQCIYIAEMKNPWTLASPRVLISRPEYEWERQWVNPDGNKSAYPIYVNENPEAFVSSDKVYIYYCASGSWTPYYCVGRLEAGIHADLLDARSWKKSPEPVFRQNPEAGIYGPGGVSFVPDRKKERWYMLYHARSIPCDPAGGLDSRTPRLQVISFTPDGEPILGEPH